MRRLTGYGLSHIDWHLQAGLAIVFAEDPAGVAAHTPNTSKLNSKTFFILSQLVSLAAWNDLCPAYNLLTTAQLGGIA